MYDIVSSNKDIGNFRFG